MHVIRWCSRKQGEASPLAEEPCWRRVGRWILVNKGNSIAVMVIETLTNEQWMSAYSGYCYCTCTWNASYHRQRFFVYTRFDIGPAPESRSQEKEYFWAWPQFWPFLIYTFHFSRFAAVFVKVVDSVCVIKFKFKIN